MTKVTTIFKFKDGTTVKNTDTFNDPDAKSKVFQGMSKGFENDADITATSNGKTIAKKYSEIEAFEVIFG